MHSSYRTATTQAVTWSKECINQGFYNSLYVHQSIRPENYQLNDVRFTISYDRAIRRTCGFAAQPERTSRGCTRAKGGEKPAVCDLHEKPHRDGCRALSWLASLSLSSKLLIHVIQ